MALNLSSAKGARASLTCNLQGRTKCLQLSTIITENLTKIKEHRYLKVYCGLYKTIITSCEYVITLVSTYVRTYLVMMMQ